MGDARRENRINSFLIFEPFEEQAHLARDARGFGSLVMDTLAADRARNYLHRAGCIIAPIAYSYLCHPAAPGAGPC